MTGDDRLQRALVEIAHEVGECADYQQALKRVARKLGITVAALRKALQAPVVPEGEGITPAQLREFQDRAGFADPPKGHVAKRREARK